MRITSTGNVGIGTNNPLSLLHIEGNAEGAGYTTYQNFLFLKNTNTAGGAVPGVNLFVAAESDALGVEFVSNGTVTSNGSAVVKGYASRSSGHFRITNLSTSGSEFIFRTAVAGSTTQVNRMYIDSSGNTTFSGTIVGGGTITVPSDVSAAGGYKINYTSADAGSRSWKIANDNAAYGDFWIGQSTTQAGSSYSIKLYISTAGNVGIGTASPASQATGQTTGILDVSAAAGGNLVLHRTSGGDTALFSILKASNGTYIDSAGAATAANNAIYFRTNNINADQTSLTTALTITSGGVVGIGATPASQSGGAYAGSTEMAGILRIQGTGRYFTSGDGLEISKSAIYSYNRATSAYNDLGINDAMIIRGAGNVLIGTSTDYGGKIQSRHDGNGAGSTYSGVHIMNSSSAIGAGVAARLSFNADGGSYQYGIIEHRRDGGDSFWIKTQGSGNGNIYVQANTNGVYVAKDSTSWTSNSDERLKNIVGNIENAVESLNTLRTVKHTWKSDKTNKEYYALIAQDVEKVLPNVIDKSKLGNGDDTEYLGVRYTELVPVLVKAIQELNTKLDAATVEIEALKSR